VKATLFFFLMKAEVVVLLKMFGSWLNCIEFTTGTGDNAPWVTEEDGVINGGGRAPLLSCSGWL